MLKVIGKILKFSKAVHIHTLGHYLEGTGAVLDLSDRVDWEGMELTRFTKLTRGRDIHNDIHYAISQLNDRRSIPNKNDVAFNTWGKAVLAFNDIEVKKMYNGSEYWDVGSYQVPYAIMDTYVFYAWCGNDSHLANCRCGETKSWANIGVKKQFDILKTEKGQNINKHFNLEVDGNKDTIILKLLYGDPKKGIKTKEKKFKHKNRGLYASIVTIFSLRIRRDHKGLFIRIGFCDWVFSRLGRAFQYYAIRPYKVR